MPRPGERSSSEGGGGLVVLLLAALVGGGVWMSWPWIAPVLAKVSQSAAEASATQVAQGPTPEGIPEPPRIEPTTIPPTSTPEPSPTPHVLSVQELKTLISNESFWIVERAKLTYQMDLRQDLEWQVLGPVAPDWKPSVGSVTVVYLGDAYVDLGIDMNLVEIEQDGNNVMIRMDGIQVRQPIAVVGTVLDVSTSGVMSPRGVDIPDYAQGEIRKLATVRACEEAALLAKVQAEKRIVELVRTLAPELIPVVDTGAVCRR